MIWKEIEGFDYLISKEVIDLGNNVYQPLIMNMKGKIMKPWVTDRYYRIGLYKNSKEKYFRVHRLYAKAFIPNPLHKPFVDHINRITTDNRLQNLRWVTQSENQRNTKKWGCIYKIKRLKPYRVKWYPKPNIQKTKSFKTYEEAKEFLDSKKYDIYGNEIV